MHRWLSTGAFDTFRPHIYKHSHKKSKGSGPVAHGRSLSSNCPKGPEALQLCLHALLCLPLKSILPLPIHPPSTWNSPLIKPNPLYHCTQTFSSKPQPFSPTPLSCPPQGFLLCFFPTLLQFLSMKVHSPVTAAPECQTAIY